MNRIVSRPACLEYGETAERLEGIYKNPQTSTGDKMRALLDAFPNGRVILLLDNFETLIDPESLSLRDSELSEALNALLGGQHHAVKAVITTRITPRDLAVIGSGPRSPSWDHPPATECLSESTTGTAGTAAPCSAAAAATPSARAGVASGRAAS